LTNIKEARASAQGWIASLCG